MADPVETFLSRLTRGGQTPQVCLVHGDLVMAEPAARRVAEALAHAAGLPPAAVEVHRRPQSLSPLLQDLRTFSLFASGKVLLATATAVFADRGAAGELIDEAAEAVPMATDGHTLSGREREAASRLLQALRLFDIDPYAGEPERPLSELPVWVLEGGRARKSKRGKKQVEELRSQLAGLLAAARREEIQGTGEGDLTELSEVVRNGLPPGHALVLAESAVAADHPLVK
ncbi:MAG TPA: hypothetical protein VIJ26_13745, partial [Thermoanaerobaculia bacterium]